MQVQKWSLLLFSFGLLTLTACGRSPLKEATVENDRQDAPSQELNAALGADQVANDGDADDSAEATATVEANATVAAPKAPDAVPTKSVLDPKKLHIVIVPGWGFQLGKILNFDYQAYAAWFVAAGAPAANVHVLSYSYLKDMATVETEIAAQLKTLTASLDKDAKIDLVGHSMGGFTGLYGALKGGYASRVRKVISISGIPFGMNSKLCDTGACGASLKDIVPFQTAFVMDFHKAFSKEIAGFEKCSLFSKADLFVKPYNAGAFPGGHNVDVNGMGHLQAIGKKKFFDLMFTECYGGKFQ